MIHSFYFNGRKSRDFGIYISGAGTYNFPERDVEMVEVQGRNGVLMIDHHRFKNITLTYPAFIREKFKEMTDEARIWLMANPGYQRLEDTYHPEQFRIARFTGPMDWDMVFENRSGKCDMVFDCKPQRYLKMGQYAVTVSYTHLDVYKRQVLHFTWNPDPHYPWKGKGITAAVKDIANNLKQATATEKGFMESKWKPSVIVKVDGLIEEFSNKTGRKKLMDEYLSTNEAGEPWIIPADQFAIEQIKPLSLADLAIKDTVELNKRTRACLLYTSRCV